ncbi:MAG: FAD-binding protein [Desulfatiglandaceae bacterium]|jgi:electron transfer flavoprotein alpha subunit/NAD-dependent dihydropyrimidine dehydrogenase PreA subunit
MTIWIEAQLCDGCKRCLKNCPYDAIEMVDGKANILDRCTSCGACLSVCKKGAILSDAKPREVPDFNDRVGVWVFAEQRNGELSRVSFELLGKAQDLAADLDQTVSAVLLGDNVEHLIETLVGHGADTVYVAQHKALADYRTIAYTNVIAELIQSYKPNIFLIGATHIGRDLAPRMAHRVGVGLTADCTELTIDPEEKYLLQTRPAFGGNIMATIANRFSRPQMATVRPGVMKVQPVPAKKGEIRQHTVNIDESAIGTEVLETVRTKKPGKEITEAKVIVSGGRGVNGKEGFALLSELAEIMEGDLAGTRIAVEQGNVPTENQIGQTGKTVRPEIYIACGLSGAIQHRAGIVDSRYIVAINTDPTAPIFKVADWGIVANLQDIVPELIRQLRKV